MSVKDFDNKSLYRHGCARLDHLSLQNLFYNFYNFGKLPAKINCRQTGNITATATAAGSISTFPIRQEGRGIKRQDKTIRMVGFKKVPSLKDCVKREIPKIVKNYIIKSAYNLNIQWYVFCAGYTNSSSEEILTIQMERFRRYLLENIVWTDREEIFYLILRGVDEGIMKVRRGWSKDKKHDQYMKVMEAVTLFTDTVQFPDLRAIDFGEIPRTIRYRIMEMIPFFTRLKVLIIGPGNAGSWIPIKVILSSTGRLAILVFIAG